MQFPTQFSYFKDPSFEKKRMMPPPDKYLLNESTNKTPLPKANVDSVNVQDYLNNRQIDKYQNQNQTNSGINAAQIDLGI